MNDGQADQVLPHPATALQVIYGPNPDPFDCALQLTAEPEGRRVAIGIHLTPAVLAELLDELLELDDAQREQLGLPPSRIRPHRNDQDLDTAPHPDEVTDGDPGAGDGQGVFRRATDPVGLRHLRGNPRTTTVMAIALGAALFIALILQVVQR